MFKKALTLFISICTITFASSLVISCNLTNKNLSNYLTEQDLDELKKISRSQDALSLNDSTTLSEILNEKNELLKKNILDNFIKIGKYSKKEYDEKWLQFN